MTLSLSLLVLGRVALAMYLCKINILATWLRKGQFFSAMELLTVMVAHLTFLDVVFPAVIRESDSSCGEAKTT